MAPPTSSSRNSKICTVQLRNPKWEVGGVIVTLFCEIDPTKSLNAAGYRFLNVSFQKISPCRGVLGFLVSVLFSVYLIMGCTSEGISGF